MKSVEKYLINKLGTQFAYGHREILLKYLNLDEDLLILGVLQHGVGLQEDIESDLTTPRNHWLRRVPYFLFSECTAREIRKRNKGSYIAIGAPWLYMVNNIDKFHCEELTSSSNYVLIVPSHHSFSVTRLNIQQIKSRIVFWKKNFQNEEIVILLSASEFLSFEWQRAALELEVELVCAGMGALNLPNSLHSSRVNFLPNLFNFIKNSRYCVFEVFTSALFYAANLSKECFFIETIETESVSNISKSHYRETEWLKDHFSCGVSNFNEFNHAVSSDFLGADNLKSQLELREIMDFYKLESVGEERK